MHPLISHRSCGDDLSCCNEPAVCIVNGRQGDRSDLGPGAIVGSNDIHMKSAVIRILYGVILPVARRLPILSCAIGGVSRICLESNCGGR